MLKSNVTARMAATKLYPTVRATSSSCLPVACRTAVIAIARPAHTNKNIINIRIILFLSL